MGLMCSLVPVAGVLRIPFPAMQVGMDPGRLLPGRVLLGNVVGAIEIPPGIPPKSLQQWRQARRGHSFAQRGTEFFDRHTTNSTPAGALRFYRRPRWGRSRAAKFPHLAQTTREIWGTRICGQAGLTGPAWCPPGFSGSARLTGKPSDQRDSYFGRLDWGSLAIPQICGSAGSKDRWPVPSSRDCQ
jgi:hypothetical protein